MKTLSTVFNKKCNFIAGAQSVEQIPCFSVDIPEVAFIGRSNVGKSSLINAVVGIDGIARVSKTPGRTQQINFFNLNDCAILADLPGYGFASVSKKMRKQWDGLIMDYLLGRQQLRRAFLLVDSRRGLMNTDVEVMKILDDSAVSYQIILTKIDVCKNPAEVHKKVSEEAEKFIAVYPEIIDTSSGKNMGIKSVRQAIMNFVNE